MSTQHPRSASSLIGLPASVNDQRALAWAVRAGFLSGDTHLHHGPRREHLRPDCGCGWGLLCDAPPHGLCAASPHHPERPAFLSIPETGLRADR